MKKVLILGASGLVGKALIEELKDEFHLFGTYGSKLTNLPVEKQFHLKVDEPDKLLEVLNELKPEIVISCIRGPFDQQLDLHKQLAMELKFMKSQLYYFSTTNVFDGDYSAPHVETDSPLAVSDYGIFKIECEKMLAEILDERVSIIRIPAIWGKDSPRWNQMKESQKKDEKIEVYNNLICNNLLDIDLAKQVHGIIKEGLKGIFHLGSADLMSHAQFYTLLASELENGESLLQYKDFEKSDTTYYFTLKSNRHEFPSALQRTNHEIIEYLLSLR